MAHSNRSTMSRMLALLLAVAVFFCILTASIGLPIYIRPFYYLHIEALDLPGVSGFTADQIMDAYNEVLDYLTLPGREFGTGDMIYSESGKAHFEDCKFLFDLNAGILLLSLTVVIILAILRKANLIGPLEIGGHGSAYWGAVGAVGIPVVIGGLAALDFDRAFVIFHSIFFPGKDNWLFSWSNDQIIRILPQQFFMNCAILIGSGILVLSLSIMAADHFHHKHHQ